MEDGFGKVADESKGGAQPTQRTQSPELTQPQSNGHPGLTAAAKAGIAVGTIGGILLGVLLAIGISYLKKKKRSKAPGDTSDLVESGTSAAPILGTRQCECARVLP